MLSTVFDKGHLLGIVFRTKSNQEIQESTYTRQDNKTSFVIEFMIWIVIQFEKVTLLDSFYMDLHYFVNFDTKR